MMVALPPPPTPQVNLWMVFEILTNLAGSRQTQPGQAGPQVWVPPWVLEQWLRGWGRWAGWWPCEGAGVSSSSGCLPVSGALALPMCGSTSSVFTSQDPALVVPPVPGCWGPRG